MDSESALKPVRTATAIISPAQIPIRGRIRLPGDKSVSIRRALLTLFSEDDIKLEHYGSGEDCLTALCCLKQLGKKVMHAGDSVIVSGRFTKNRATLDCGNSGTTARLLMGLLSGIEGEWTFTGDASLSTRPMERVAKPLRQMGTRIELAEGCLPAKIRGGRLNSICYESPVASAQVKSAVLLAGLSGGVEVEYREPSPSRNHTEKLLGISPEADGWIRLSKSAKCPSAMELTGSIPGDPSSAAFWGIAATLVPESSLVMEGVLSDSLRCGWIETLQAAGAKLSITNEQTICRETVGNICCEASSLNSLEISQDFVPRVIDEIPILAVTATQASGTSIFAGVEELRVKESDRLQQIIVHLSAMGATVECERNKLCIHGSSRLNGTTIDPAGDHRIAMAFAIAGLISGGKTTIHSANCADVSYPEFWKDLSELSPDSCKYEH